MRTDPTASESDPGRAALGEMKRLAGREAALGVEPGMRLGLGTGTTVAHFLDHLAARIRRCELPGVVGVATSARTERAARGLGIPLATLAEAGSLDLTVDGADEVAPGLDLIKGLGGALLREKIVAQASRRMVVIADDTKVVPKLGARAPLPVEVTPFAHASHLDWLGDLGSEPRLRIGPDDRPYRTANGNYIVDCRFEGGIPDLPALERGLADRAGVVESGLFLGMAECAIVAGADGVRIMSRA